MVFFVYFLQQRQWKSTFVCLERPASGGAGLPNTYAYCGERRTTQDLWQARLCLHEGQGEGLTLWRSAHRLFRQRDCPEDGLHGHQAEQQASRQTWQQ